jgi:lipopolysaccharide export system protein LptA
MKVPSASASVAWLLLAALAFGAEPTPVPQRTRVSSHKLSMKTVGTETRSVLDGLPDKQVTLTGTNIQIFCDHLEIIAVGVNDKDSTVPDMEKFKYLLATGRVRIVQGEREATCGRAEVFPREDRLELTEGPVVRDHGADTLLKGSRIVMRRGQREVEVFDSEADAPAIKDLGFDKNQPPAKKTDAPPPTAPPTVTLPGLPPATKQ